MHFYKANYDKMSDALGVDSSKFWGRSMYSILLECALKKAPGAGTAIVIGTDLVDSLGQNYQAKIAVKNGITADNAVTTDCYITMVGEELISRPGPNTDKVLEYLKSKGYTLDGNQLENTKKIEEFGQSIKRYEPAKICNYLQIEVGKNSGWVE